MMAEPGRGDIVNDYRLARARLRLGRYERYLVEHIASRVARLLGKRDEGERGGGDPGDVVVAGERAVSFDSLSRAYPREHPPL